MAYFADADEVFPVFSPADEINDAGDPLRANALSGPYHSKPGLEVTVVVAACSKCRRRPDGRRAKRGYRASTALRSRGRNRLADKRIPVRRVGLACRTSRRNIRIVTVCRQAEHLPTTDDVVTAVIDRVGPSALVGMEAL